MFRIIIASVIVLSLLSSTAFAQSIERRLGLTGRVGFATPVEDDFINGTEKTETGFAVNGGLIYGFTENIAAEFEVTHLPKLDVMINGAKDYEVEITDLSLGLQYRFNPAGTVVPYVGAGADFIKGSITHISDSSHDLDWTYGGHFGAGIDWFVTNSIAFTADFRAVVAQSGDIMDGSVKVGEYDPFWYQGTFGVRLFLPKMP